MDRKHLGAAPDLAPTPSTGGVTSHDATPLFDVMLVLVIAGLVAFGVSRRARPPLPAPVEIPAVSPVPLVLELPPDAGWRVNGQSVPPAQLHRLLSAALQARPARIVFLRVHPARANDVSLARAAARESGARVVAVVEALAESPGGLAWGSAPAVTGRR